MLQSRPSHCIRDELDSTATVCNSMRTLPCNPKCRVGEVRCIQKLRVKSIAGRRREDSDQLQPQGVVTSAYGFAPPPITPRICGLMGGLRCCELEGASQYTSDTGCKSEQDCVPGAEATLSLNAALPVLSIPWGTRSRVA